MLLASIIVENGEGIDHANGKLVREYFDIKFKYTCMFY